MTVKKKLNSLNLKNMMEKEEQGCTRTRMWKLMESAKQSGRHVPRFYSFTDHVMYELDF